MLSNILRIVPTARTEKNQPQALPKHQFFAACPDAHTVTTHTVTAVAPQQSQSELYGHTADELYGQNSSDYSVQLSPPLVTLRPLHQDFTQSPGSTPAVTKPASSLPPHSPVPLLERINDWVNHWLDGTADDPAEPGRANSTHRAIGSTWLTKPRINQQGLGLLRQFEPLPSYSEQTIREIEQAVLRQVKVPLTANQFSALVSLTYSLGEANLRRSTLLKYLNTGRYQAAAREFDRWVYVGPNRKPDLVVRRAAERKLFLQSD